MILVIFNHLTKQSPLNYCLPMMKSCKKVLSGTLLVLLVAFLFVCASHFHPQSQAPEKDHCPVCQVSHHFQKQGLTASTLKVFHFQSTEEILLVSQEVSSFHFFFSASSRAPPTSI